LRPNTPNLLKDKSNKRLNNLSSNHQIEKISVKPTEYLETNFSFTNKIPKMPAVKKKEEIKNIASDSIFNKAKVAEAMKLLTYQKSYYIDHYTAALDKLNKSKSSGFLVFIAYSEVKKSFVILKLTFRSLEGCMN
jgi:hypothetical protein